MLSKVSNAAYFALLLAAAVAAYRSSDRDWNWDLLPYLGSAISSSETDPVKIHSIAYREAAATVPRLQFEILAAGTSYRTDLAKDAFHFAEQIPFYSVKALYVDLIVALHRAGMTRINAMKLISAGGFVALGIVFFRWCRVYLSAPWSALLSGLFMLSQPVLGLARVFSPDALSVALVVGALYTLFEKGQTQAGEVIGMALLACSIFVRNDNLVLAVLVIGYFSVCSDAVVRISWMHGAVLVALLIVLTMTISHAAGGYGWRTSFYHGVVQRMTAPAASLPPVSIAEYGRAWARSAREAIDGSSLLLFSFLGAGAWMAMKAGAKERSLLLLSVTFPALRFLAFSAFEERYFVATYAIVAISLVSVLGRAER